MGGSADTVTFCLSKGLGAPAGARVVGDAQTVERARHVRKRLGGAMRQTGVLAAAGQVGLDRGVGLLADDHRRARVPADAAAKMIPAALDPADVQTNIVRFETTGLGVEASAFVGSLARNGVRAKTYGRPVGSTRHAQGRERRGPSCGPGSDRADRAACAPKPDPRTGLRRSRAAVAKRRPMPRPTTSASTPTARPRGPVE
ncbi:beta-eliminating lyase-related protein [Streptomyces sp. NPDC001276]|uniref:beta-eliminating lyase-related protein n=1 Tax=Streptomyces sp. NPDC001276 TaxID=3364555 RepID=UPI003681D024